MSNETQALTTLNKSTEDGVDYYTISTGIGELSISQHQELAKFVVTKLHDMLGYDPGVIANSGIMCETKTVGIPATVMDSLSESQKKELLEPIFAKIASIRENLAFFQEAIDAHKAAGGDASVYGGMMVEGEPLKSQYNMMYRTPHKGSSSDSGLVDKKSTRLIIDKINVLMGRDVAFLDELKDNRFWAGQVCFHEDDMPDVLASPNREEIFNLLAHPETLQAKSKNLFSFLDKSNRQLF
jgi:hypothetical protein